MKRGQCFAHKYWIDPNRNPMIFEITCVRNETVFYKVKGGKRSSFKSPIGDFESKYVLEWR